MHHMMDLVVDQKDCQIIEKDYKAYISGDNKSICSRNKTFVHEVLDGKFTRVKDLIKDADCFDDFKNPFLLHDLLHSALAAYEADQNLRLDFIKFLLATPQLKKFIQDFPHSVKGRIAGTWITHHSCIGAAVYREDHDVLLAFFDIDDKKNIMSEALSVAAGSGRIKTVQFILNKLEGFTQREVDILNKIQQKITEREQNDNNIDTNIKTMVSMLQQHNLFEKSSETESLQESDDGANAGRRVIRTQTEKNEELLAFNLQELIFQNKYQEVKDFISKDDASEKSQMSRSQYTLSLLLISILNRRAENESQERIDLLKFLLTFDSVISKVKSDLNFINTAASHPDCLQAMKLFIAIDDGKTVSKTKAANMVFNRGCTESQFIPMFEMLINNSKIAATLDMEQIKKDIELKQSLKKDGVPLTKLKDALELMQARQQTLSQAQKRPRRVAV